MAAQPGVLMEPAEVWGARWDACDNDLARRYMQVACNKQSLVVLAADVRCMADLLNLIETVGPYLAALKTHVDLVDDWTAEGRLYVMRPQPLTCCYLKTGNSQILVRLVVTKWLESMAFAHGLTL